MMKRKFFLGLLLFFTLIIVTGCGNEKSTSTSKNKDIDSQIEKTDVIKKFKDKYYSIEWKCSIPLNDIRDISGFDNMFITNSGDLYMYSFTQLFSSTNDYCKKIDSNYKLKRFINGAIVTEENKVFGYIDYTFKEKYGGWTGGLDYSLFDKYPNMVLFSKDYDMNHSYAVVEGKEVFELTNKLDNAGNVIGVNKLKIGELEVDEEYINGYYHIIKTTKNYYMYSVINKEQCSKYADVNCVYGLKRIDEISDEYNNILYYNGRYIVLKDDLKHIYTNELY